MYVYNESPNIIVDLDGDKCPVDYGTVIEAIAYGATDFIARTNEGAPVNLGNDYAVYEFVAYNDGGYVFTYWFGPNEFKKLRENGTVTLEPLPWNDLEEVQLLIA